MIKKSIGIILAIILSVASSVAMADESDYIWNEQFKKKMALAEQGDAKAQYDIGKMFQKGQGTKRNSEEAFKWFSKAANQGHERAGYKVGYLYHKGEGVGKNNSKAFKWIKQSADKNYPPAMFYLGQLYASGAGTKKNLKNALSWYEKADAKGYHPAKAAVKATKSKLAQAAPPPPPPPVAAPSSKPAPAAPTRVAKKSGPSAGSSNVLASLIGSKWKTKGKSATEFPSALTECSVKNGKIVCLSKEMEREESYGTVSYKIEAVIGNIKGKEFSNQYREMVTLIFPSDPDNPDVKIPIDYGPQAAQLMRCKLVGNSGITCTTQKNKVRKFKK